MQTQRVYDWPTRLFHWLFAGLFIAAFAIANLIDDGSPRFPMHMLAGLALCAVVALRLIWGVFGTRHARFSDLVLNPMRLFAYLKGIFSGERVQWAGHNPASSWAAVAMVVLALGLGFTGWLMTSNRANESLEDVHELLANAFLAVVLLHLAGLVLHGLRYRDRMAFAMVTGRKMQVEAAPVPARPLAGLLFAGLWVLSAIGLLRHYDAQAQSLSLFGTTLQLGENEADGHGAGEKDDRHDSHSRTAEKGNGRDDDD